MSDILITLLATLSACTWAYNQAYRRNGGNTKNALTVTTVTGIVVFVVVITLLNIVGNKLSH